MNALQTLKTTLLDLDRVIGDKVPLIIGGGFGLYLRQEQLRELNEQTLIQQLPEPRATNDIDLFIGMEVLINVDKVKVMRQEIEKLGFTPIEKAKYFQWVQNKADNGQVKIDILCGPLGNFSEQLHTNGLPRVRPKAPSGELRFHARHTDEAIEVDTRSIAIQIQGQCSDGKKKRSTIYIPHPFTYLMMKLFAFDDRKNDLKKDSGRHHAMDLYRTVGMMNESEYEEALALGNSYNQDKRVKRARQIVSNNFDKEFDLGIIRLREHTLFRAEFEIQKFQSVLKEILVIPE